MTRVLASFAHEYETSIALAEERLKALRGRDDASTVVLALLKNLIGARLDTGADFGSLCEEQQVLAERGEDEFEIADAFISYALHYDRVGARHLSRTLLQAAADIAQRLHDPHMRTMALVNISAMWVGSDVDTAADSGREAVREAHGLGDSRGPRSQRSTCSTPCSSRAAGPRRRSSPAVMPAMTSTRSTGPWVTVTSP